ncbi:hypothetical protein C8F04DRAFT_977400 [Mycena alexandri]|uniref:F-box domain-containing protein n=1 Tax=Mycena alexandri TaxID=1745969 RepID=A0AAD6WMP8_9AGAR|nr:hypothetical protein C8F04DRAFT_977400 [Mycena alexandri]
MSVTITQLEPAARKTRARALSLVLVAKSAPFLDIPAELGLEILELGLTHTPFSTLAVVSKTFHSLISTILYRHVVLDSVETLSLFARTVKSKSQHFLDAHIKTLAVTIEPWSFTSAKRIELEGTLASCTGLHTLFIPLPGILIKPLSRHPLHRALPSEVTIQSFDTAPLFEWDSGISAPAAHLSSSLTHLRISEPGDTWHSPLSILEFFGSTPHLTHFALARRMDANIENDQVFVDEMCTLLASRPNLKMLVVRIFPSQWPRYIDENVSPSSSSIWEALSIVAEADQRVVLVAAGLDGPDDTVFWANVRTSYAVRPDGLFNFWERSRIEWETQSTPDLEA